MCMYYYYRVRFYRQVEEKKKRKKKTAQLGVYATAELMDLPTLLCSLMKKDKLLLLPAVLLLSIHSPKKISFNWHQI